MKILDAFLQSAQSRDSRYIFVKGFKPRLAHLSFSKFMRKIRFKMYHENMVSKPVGSQNEPEKQFDG